MSVIAFLQILAERLPWIKPHRKADGSSRTAIREPVKASRRIVVGLFENQNYRAILTC
jgi:hypothetical protein